MIFPSLFHTQPHLREVKFRPVWGPLPDLRGSLLDSSSSTQVLNWTMTLEALSLVLVRSFLPRDFEACHVVTSCWVSVCPTLWYVRYIITMQFFFYLYVVNVIHRCSIIFFFGSNYHKGIVLYCTECSSSCSLREVESGEIMRC